MPFTVVWLPKALQKLAQLWIDAPDKNALGVAADALEHILRFHPEKAGQVVGNARFLIVKPLAIRYLVSPDDCLVTVEHIALIP